jgi:hypothetical protein
VVSSRETAHGILHTPSARRIRRLSKPSHPSFTPRRIRRLSRPGCISEAAVEAWFVSDASFPQVIDIRGDEGGHHRRPKGAMREAIRGDEGGHQGRWGRQSECPRVGPGGGQGGGVRVQAGAVRGVKPWERGSRVECRVAVFKAKKVVVHVSPKVRTQTPALAHGGTLAAGTAQARRERTGNGMCSPGTGSTKGSAALRRDSTQTSLSRHMSCTRKRRGAQPAPGEQRLPEPPIDAAASLSSCAACLHLP